MREDGADLPVDGAVLEASTPDDVARLGLLLGKRVDVLDADWQDPFCVWCGHRTARVPEDTLDERVSEHVKLCAASPWRALETAVRMIAKAEKVGQVMDAITIAQGIVAILDEDQFPDAPRIAAIVEEWNAESAAEPSGVEVAMVTLGVLDEIAKVPHGDVENKAVTMAQNALSALAKRTL
jgi:hypothetical protein